VTTAIKFEIPSSVRIRGRVWHVRHWRDLSEAARAEFKERGASFRGITWPKAREIWLGRHSSARALRATFLHELLHACSSDNVSAAAEETFIRDVEHPLFAALEQLRWRKP
jgi:hypothetical protein